MSLVGFFSVVRRLGFRKNYSSPVPLFFHVEYKPEIQVSVPLESFLRGIAKN